MLSLWKENSLDVTEGQSETRKLSDLRVIYSEPSFGCRSASSVCSNGTRVREKKEASPQKRRIEDAGNALAGVDQSSGELRASIRRQALIDRR